MNNIFVFKYIISISKYDSKYHFINTISKIYFLGYYYIISNSLNNSVHTGVLRRRFYTSFKSYYIRYNLICQFNKSFQ